MVMLDLEGLQLKLKNEGEKTFVFDIIRKRWVRLTPEEHVRQYILLYLTQRMAYPAALISVEKKIMAGKVSKRFDIVVYDRSHQPWMLIECKEPEVMISAATLFQLLNYHRAIPCKFWVLTNGHQSFCAAAAGLEEMRWQSRLPAYDL
jgi:hypothetical protein